jgi:hypothetical protein
MKVYPPDAAERLGFDTILRELARLSETETIRAQFLELQPSHNPLLKIYNWQFFYLFSSIST